MKKALITMGLLCVSFMSIAAPTPEQYQALAKAETLLRDNVVSDGSIPDKEKDAYITDIIAKLRKLNATLLMNGESCEQIDAHSQRNLVNNERTVGQEAFALRVVGYQSASCRVQASSMN